MTGWGNFGENLLTNLWHTEYVYYPVIVKPQRQYEQVPVLRDIFQTQSQVPKHFASGYGYSALAGSRRAPFAIMHSISGAFEKDIKAQVGLVTCHLQNKSFLSSYFCCEGDSLGREECCPVLLRGTGPMKISYEKLIWEKSPP